MASTTSPHQQQREGRPHPGLVWLLLAAALIGCSPAGGGDAGGHAAKEPPAEKLTGPPWDVLFIPVDDLNDWVGFLKEHPSAQTPAMDRLARRGMVFTKAYAPAPSCNPSRTAILTGIPPHRSGVYLNHQPWRELLPDAVTLPEYFRAAGYSTLGGGKVFHHLQSSEREWDEVHLEQRNDPTPPGWRGEEKLRPRSPSFDWAPLDVAPSRMSDWRLASWASQQLRRPSEDPLFLAAGFYRPHLPWHVPARFFEPFPLEEVQLPEVREDDLSDLPEVAVELAHAYGDHEAIVQQDVWREAVQAYLASVYFADQCVSNVLRALDRSPRSERTIVVLWGDHGWQLGEKEHWRKFALWEDTTRVPLIILAPGFEGGTCERPVGLIDLYATLIDLCDLPPREDIAGRSLVPLLEDPWREDWEDLPVLSTYGPGNHTLRGMRWRYIRYADGSEELYDHRSDPEEWTNLAGEERYANIVKRMARQLPRDEVPLPEDIPAPAAAVGIAVPGLDRVEDPFRRDEPGTATREAQDERE